MFLASTPARCARPLQRRLGAALLLLSLVQTWLPGLSVSATQSGTVADPYISELLGWSVTASGPNYQLETVALEEYPHGQGERIYVTNVEGLGFVELAFFDDLDTPEQTIEVTLSDFSAAADSLEVLDTGVANNIYYALARFDLGQSLLGYFYIEVTKDVDGSVDLAQSIYSTDANFLEQVEVAREEISLDGEPFLTEPVIDLDAAIAADVALLASTPEPIATPDRGTFAFETNNAELVVDEPIEFNFPFTSTVLEVMYLASEHGYGIVGFIHQDAESAESVLAGVFVGAPVGAEAPVELLLDANDDHALGVYRIETQGETRAMVIEVIRLDEGLWIVQAMAVTESEFASELRGYQRGVLFEGEPLLGDVDPDVIVTILNER